MTDFVETLILVSEQFRYLKRLFWTLLIESMYVCLTWIISENQTDPGGTEKMIRGFVPEAIV